MRILVTGSAGFIGRHLSAALRERYPGASLCKIDLVESEDCLEWFREDHPFDLVFHCAATVGGREGIDYNAAMLAAQNMQMDGALFEWALRTRPGRVVYFSSAAAYPVHKQLLAFSLDEDDIDLEYVGGRPDNTYGWVKLMGEVVAERVRAAGVKISVVRPFSSYDYDQDDCYPFPQFMRRAAERQSPFVVWGDGRQVRDWIHVDDLVGAILTMVDEGIDGPVNLGTGVGTSMDQLAQLAMTKAGYDAPIEHLWEKPMGVKYRIADNRLMRSFYEPKISIEEGVERALALVRV